MQENNVPSSDQKAASLSFGWLNEAPEGESFVGSYGRIFDVIAMSKPDGNTFGLHIERLNLACSKAVGRY